MPDNPVITLFAQRYFPESLVPAGEDFESDACASLPASDAPVFHTSNVRGANALHADCDAGDIANRMRCSECR